VSKILLGPIYELSVPMQLLHLVLLAFSICELQNKLFAISNLCVLAD